MLIKAPRYQVVAPPSHQAVGAGKIHQIESESLTGVCFSSVKLISSLKQFKIGIQIVEGALLLSLHKDGVGLTAILRIGAIEHPRIITFRQRRSAVLLLASFRGQLHSAIRFAVFRTGGKRKAAHHEHHGHHRKQIFATK